MDLPYLLNNAKIITQEIRELLCNATIFSILGAKLHSLRVALQFSRCARHNPLMRLQLYMEVAGALLFPFSVVALARNLAHTQ